MQIILVIYFIFLCINPIINTSVIDWVKNVPDDTYLYELHLVGTHNSIAVESYINKPFQEFSNCQSSIIEKQLEDGIQVLDLRVRLTKKALAMHHGIFYYNVNFGDVLNNATKHLDKYPFTFLIFFINNAHTVDSEHNYNDVYNSYLKDYDSYLYSPESQDRELNSITVGEIRGKILIIGRSNYFTSDYGILFSWRYRDPFYFDSSTIVQDVYDVRIENKLNRVTKAFRCLQGLNSDYILINFMSVQYHFPISIKTASQYIYWKLLDYQLHNIPPSIIMLDFATDIQIRLLLELNTKYFI